MCGSVCGSGLCLGSASVRPRNAYAVRDAFDSPLDTGATLRRSSQSERERARVRGVLCAVEWSARSYACKMLAPVKEARRRMGRRESLTGLQVC